MPLEFLVSVLNNKMNCYHRSVQCLTGKSVTKIRETFLQDQTFLRDFGLFANNIGSANNSAHGNLTSWGW